MKEPNWSYLAGIIDGEGCIFVGRAGRINATGYSYELGIRVKNTDLRLMKWLVEHFGGVYYIQNQQEGWKTAYSWQPKGAKNKEGLLLGILPYLVLKREQALVGLAYLRTTENKSDARECLYQQSKELNRRGESVETNTLASEQSEKIESGLVGNNESTPVVIQAV